MFDRLTGIAHLSTPTQHNDIFIATTPLNATRVPHPSPSSKRRAALFTQYHSILQYSDPPSPLTLYPILGSLYGMVSNLHSSSVSLMGPSGKT